MLDKGLEEFVWDELVVLHGGVHISTTFFIKTNELENSQKYMSLAFSEFRNNSNADNYNLMIMAMIRFQYWTQKKTFPTAMGRNL
tara:strand:- start:2392 stop:2646 length:255 start_codon:yes stop_codon:yes gene_type:complete